MTSDPMPPQWPHLSARLRSLLAALTLLPGALSAAMRIHVSRAGDDTNPGTATLPVATPQGAQVRVRSLIQAGLTEAVDVIFSAGTWQMTAPLELRPEDSGTAVFPITWKAAAGASVILSGGRTITGTWIQDGGGIWRIDLPGTGLGPGAWNFRQLFVSGQRAIRARYPNANAANPFLYATGGDFDYLTITPALVKAAWGTAPDAQINIVPQSRFFNQWNTVTAVNPATGRIDIADSERHRLIDSGSWFWIEGVRSELDQPGEWFLDAPAGRLYYLPPAGVDPNTLTITAPFLTRIINAKGDVNAGTSVRQVHFNGIEFRDTDFTLGHIEARVHTDTAIMFENTSDSSVRNCRFENIGGYALWLHLDSQRNAFDRNTVTWSGGGGVLLTGARFAYMDDSRIQTPGIPASKVAPILNSITRNTVEHCGRIRYYGGGVHLDSRPFSMTMAPGNYIAHNLFNDLSRNGVFAFRNQGGNVIEYNHIHNAMQTTIDGACIHFATMNTLNAPNHILNNWLYDVWGYRQNPDGVPTRTLASGVFLDWDTSNTTVKDNWIYNCPAAAVKVIFGGNRNVVNTGNQSSSTVITPPFAAETGPGGTASNNIDPANNKLTGSVVSYQDTALFSRTGTWAQESAVGLANLFEFNYLTATSSAASQAVYTLPIPEDGDYQISLIYYRGTDRATNAPVSIRHADGTASLTWNMQQGSPYGFAVPIGTYRFVAAETNTVTLATTGANGKVVADSVAFVKVSPTPPPPPDPGGPTTLVEHVFTGTGAPLNGTAATRFESVITAAGGSGIWAAGANFLDNGVIGVESNNRSAFLNLGSYINNAAGSATGRFELSLTIPPVTGTWISLGFAAETNPETGKNFTNTGTGAGNTNGAATIIHRASTGSPPGELDMFGGPRNTNIVDGPDNNTGSRTLTVILDLTPAGGYNGVGNFGTVTWEDSVLGGLGSFTYPSAQTFGSILISEASSSGGTISGLRLIRRAAPRFEVTISGNGPDFDFSWPSKAGKLYNLVSSTSLSTPVRAWPVWDSRAGIPSAGATTTLMAVPGGGSSRFFAVIER